jgi:phage antirepressor YoqD-like protein
MCQNYIKKEVMSKNLSFLEAGKILGTSNLKLINFLKINKFLFKNNYKNLPYQKHIDNGYFEVKPLIINKGKENSFTVSDVKITQKGFNHFKNIFRNYNIEDLERDVNKTMFLNISKLGLEYDRFKILIEINKNNDVTYFQYKDENFIPLVKYNKTKLVIIDRYDRI